MSDTDDISIPQGKKRKKRKSNFGFLYLFLFVFLIALAGISYIVKSYSPDIDVAIGNNEALTLNESEMEMEVKSVDERLKWIQMEDELPTVALRNPDLKREQLKELLMQDDSSEKIEKRETKTSDKNNEKKEDSKSLKTEEKKQTKEIPIPTISEIKKQHSDFREIPTATPVIPAPVPSVTRVYLGKYSTIDEAIKIQNDIASVEPSLAPFVKAVNGSYIVQLGSFSEKDRANALVSKLRAKGYNPKVNYEN